MPEQTENIEDLKNVVSFVLDTAEAGERVLEDKKVEAQESFAEAMILVGKLSKVKNVKAAVEQTQQLKNPIKQQELLEFIKKDLDLKNDKVEELVESALQLIKNASDLVALFKEIRQN